MKNWKTFIFTLILAIGFIVPSCQPDDDDGTSCDGLVPLPFFDIQGFDIGFYTEELPINDNLIGVGETVRLDNFQNFFFSFSLNYHALNLSPQKANFSFIPTMNACSPIFGDQGSKEEELLNFSIITLNDFDENHLAGDTINDLFDHIKSYSESWTLETEEIQPLEDFLDNLTGTIQFEALHLQLKQAPTINEEFKVKVVVELSTGEIYEVEKEGIVVLPN